MTLNHNETLVEAVRSGIIANHNDTVVIALPRPGDRRPRPAVPGTRGAMTYNHNETLLAEHDVIATNHNESLLAGTRSGIDLRTTTRPCSPPSAASSRATTTRPCSPPSEA